MRGIVVNGGLRRETEVEERFDHIVWTKLKKTKKPTNF